jgi:hypothetical protein
MGILRHYFNTKILQDQFPIVNSHTITQVLDKTNRFWFTLYVSVVAFGLYTCVYAFRKSFVAGIFAEGDFLGIDFKIWLVTSQVLGYAISKFAGIKIISELQPSQRSIGILVTVLIAWLSWLAFALVPPPFNIIFPFFNGLVLGLVWGMVFSYLEGRRVTEILGAALSISFIFSSGLCRSVGGHLLMWIPEKWMPFTAGAIFAIPLGAFLFLLDKIPAPDALDQQHRARRQPMDILERKKFLKTFLPGIVLFVLAYMLLTAFRDFRDNFSTEIWTNLGFSNSPGIYTKTEIPVSLGVIFIMGSVTFIRQNNLALLANHIIILAGMVTLGSSALLYMNDLISPTVLMILTGLGLYLGYVPFNSIFFDRMLAAFRYSGTVGFIMYVADSFGYLGSVAILIIKEFFSLTSAWLDFFLVFSLAVSGAGGVLILLSMIYFLRKLHDAKVTDRASVIALRTIGYKTG